MLVALLSKLVTRRFATDKPHTFNLVWRLLYALGTQVVHQDGDFIIVSSKGQ